jgi:hypothetical protein
MSNINLTCKNCKKEFTTLFKHRDKKYCSRKCYFEDPSNKIGRKKDNNLYEDRNCIVCSETFNVRKKVKRTMCSDECRIKHNLDNKETRIEAAKAACLEKYGVDSTFKIKEFQNKAKEAFVLKYKSAHPMHCDDIKSKMSETYDKKRIKKYIEKSDVNDIEIIEIVNPLKVFVKCKICNHSFYFTQLKNNRPPICRKCNPITKNNTLNEVIEKILIDLGKTPEKNNRSLIKPNEIDFLVDGTIGFEVNGNYWHSEHYGGKDKNYHIDKTKMMNYAGGYLIHIFEDEIKLKYDIVKSRIENKLNLTKNKIYARNCKIEKVTNEEQKEFFNKNHIQGYTPYKFCFSLKYENDIVAMISFGGNRIIKKGSSDKEKFELIRFSNKINTYVVGGFSRLLNHFKKEVKTGIIVTYSDIRWNGFDHNNVYTKNGFKHISTTKPNYWYVNTKNFCERKHRFSFRKDILVKSGFDSNKTEKEIMFENGYDIIWDCGSHKYEIIF